MRVPVNIIIPENSKVFTAKVKCKTCAYRTPSTLDEDEMGFWYFKEQPIPHPCHERKKGIACVGSMEKHEGFGWAKPSESIKP